MSSAATLCTFNTVSFHFWCFFHISPVLFKLHYHSQSAFSIQQLHAVRFLEYCVFFVGWKPLSEGSPQVHTYANGQSRGTIKQASISASPGLWCRFMKYRPLPVWSFITTLITVFISIFYIQAMIMTKVNPDCSRESDWTAFKHITWRTLYLFMYT